MLSFWFSPFGRTSRSDYWSGLVVPFLVVFVLIAVLSPIVLEDRSTDAVILTLLTLFAISHTFCSIRRLHDLGLSGWLVLALVIPMILGLGYLFEPSLFNWRAVIEPREETRFLILALVTLVIAPFAYVLALVWFTMGKDGMNRYGKDPLYR